MSNNFSQKKTFFEFELRNKMKIENESLKDEVELAKSTKWLFQNQQYELGMKQSSSSE